VRELQGWRALSAALVPVMLRLSPRQLERTEFTDLVARLTREAEVEQQYLQFQLPESEFLHSLEHVGPCLQQLRHDGYKVFMDQFTFSASYSTIAQITRLPIDGIRLAPALIDHAAGTLTRLPIIRAILELSQTAGLVTIADGVEAHEQLSVLIEHGCDLAQGSFLGEPLAAGDTQHMLLQPRDDDRLNESLRTQRLRQR
jgi:EAL domain-containing protein (putative c-di-GMP-specific phosphodiesterase class I)